MKTIKLSCSHALFKYLIAQKTIIDGKKVPLFPGAFGRIGKAVAKRCLGFEANVYVYDPFVNKGLVEENNCMEP